MHSVNRFAYGLFVFSLLLAACAPQSTPTAADSAASEPSPAQPTSTNVPPTLELVSLDLGEPPAGTEMQWVDGGTMVFVPGTEFVRGAGGADNPLHTVVLSSFWIYRTKVTNRMYGLCVAVGVCSPPAAERAAAEMVEPHLLDRPIVDVTWQQAQSYCEWVQGGLPTEAQWELTARGPESLVYPWGESAPSCDLLNFGDCLGKTSRVFDYLNAASPYGALDMAGNAYEWTADWYDADYYPNGLDQDPPGPRVGTERAVRGSGFESPAADVPSALRFHANPQQSRPDLGFRCVVSEPGVFPPYCQTSAYVPGDPGSPPPSKTCNVDNREVARNCGFGAHEIIHGGELRSVRGEPPLTCEVAGGNRIACTGPASYTGAATVAVTCGPITPSSRLEDPACIRGYEPIPGSEVTCAISTGDAPAPPDGGTGSCPPGYTERPGPGGLTFCLPPAREEDLLPRPVPAEPEEPTEPETGVTPEIEEVRPVEEPARDRDCPSGMETVVGADGSVTCRATTPDGTPVECPGGTVPVLTTDGWFCLGRGPARTTDPCPPGTYAAEGGRFCIGASRPRPGGSPGGSPGTTCIEGFVFSPLGACCEAPGGLYPGCGAEEYYDTVHGCQPRAGASGGLVTIITFDVSTGACADGGDDNPCTGLDKNACYGTTGCTWDDAGSFCH
jgi:formylglycine-generating enzyme required for sulfatase activity